MNLSEEQKNYMLKEYLRHISHMQDIEYQIRVWIKNEGPECQAFDDAVCDFFDIEDPILEDYKNFGISEIQYSLLKNFRDKFRAFSNENDRPFEFIETPEWVKIMQSAKEVLRAFNYNKEP